MGYKFFIEPNQLESTTHQVSIGSQKRHFTKAHVTDLHTKGMGAVEHKLIAAIKENKPDMVLIIGDIATSGGSAKGYEEVLAQLKAPLGL